MIVYGETDGMSYSSSESNKKSRRMCKMLVITASYVSHFYVSLFISEKCINELNIKLTLKRYKLREGKDHRGKQNTDKSFLSLDSIYQNR